MKQSLQSAVILLFCLVVASVALCTGGQPEGKGRPEDKGKPERPSFIPETETIKIAIDRRVFVTRERIKRFSRGYAKYLYVTDASGSLVKKLALHAKDFQPSSVRSFHSRKYVVLSMCCGPTPETRERVIVLNMEGNILWQSSRSEREVVTNVGLDDETNRALLIDGQHGFVEVRSVSGKLLSPRSRFSDWGRDSEGKGESSGTSSVTSEAGKYVAIARTRNPLDEAIPDSTPDRYELTLLDRNGRKVMQKMIDGWDGRVLYLSAKHGTVIVRERNADGWQDAAYDFDGKVK